MFEKKLKRMAIPLKKQKPSQVLTLHGFFVGGERGMNDYFPFHPSMIPALISV